MKLDNISESLTIDFKSIRKIREGDKGFRELAVACVAFANAQGGTLYIGIEDKSHAPLPGQRISNKEYLNAIERIKSNCCGLALESDEIHADENGNEFFFIKVFPSLKTFASTGDGRFYIRVGDKCMPMHSEDIHRIAADKEAFQWELICTRKFPLSSVNHEKIVAFSNDIRQSPRVSDHIKQMTDNEIISNYNLVENGYLTNLGVLWLGDASQRSRISYPITVQYIVYDNLENKIRKIVWHDQLLNPKELLLDVEDKAVELTYSFEFPDGLFRKQVRHYHPKVVREYLLNAFAHKSFVTSGDIIIEVYQDRMEISNPGSLPLGVTKDNILHQRQRRNPHFIRIMHDLNLMEGEGSGYDLIYEINALDVKQNPLIENDFNSVRVTQYSNIQNQELLPLFSYVSSHYKLTQKNIIALGMIAQNEKIAATDLVVLLQLSEKGRMRHYVDNLVAQGIVITRGVKKGTQYLVNPQLMKNSKLNIVTTLKTIEPHRLEALIEMDLKQHPNSSKSEIAERLPDVDIKDIQKKLYAMVKEKKLSTTGARGNRRYNIPT